MQVRVKVWARPKFVFGLVMSVVVSLGSIPATSQDKTDSEEPAIRQARRDYMDAIQRRDIPSAKAAWTKEGKYIDATGASHAVQELIDKQLAAKPAELPNNADRQTLPDVASTIRLVAPNVAIEEGKLILRQSAESAVDAGTYTAVWVKSENRWLLDTLCESSGNVEANGSPLAALGWMIGQWTAAGDDFRILCTTEWSLNQKFIVRRFTMERSNGDVVHGTQRIGWDPAAARIRSWEFDSEGGFSEGVWRREGDAWVVKVAGILPNGTRTASAVFWISEDPNRIAMKTSFGQVGETNLDEHVVEFQRVMAGE